MAVSIDGGLSLKMLGFFHGKSHEKWMIQGHPYDFGNHHIFKLCSESPISPASKLDDSASIPIGEDWLGLSIQDVGKLNMIVWLVV